MSEQVVRVSDDWLALREPADAAARSRELVEHLGPPATGRWVIHDLGGGTGSMGRWLAPLLPGPQRWVVHDRDTELLALAADDVPGPAADGAAVTVETRQSDMMMRDTTFRIFKGAFRGGKPDSRNAIIWRNSTMEFVSGERPRSQSSAPATLRRSPPGAGRSSLP